MNDFVFSANAVLPIIILVALGWLLKKIKLLTPEFLRVGNKLTFTVLLPTLLFYNVYQIESFSEINWLFILYAVIAVFAVFLIAIPVTLVFTKENSMRGVLIQAIFRSNYAIIGIPLATQLFGKSGAAAASVLSAFSIPVFNILAVITLSFFNGKSDEKTAPDLKKVFIGIIKNPLIIGVFAGLLALLSRSLFVKLEWGFRLTDLQFLFTAIKYVGNATTPIALIVLGGQFEFTAISRLKKQIIFGTIMRTVVVPLITLLPAAIFLPGLGGECFAAYVALFGTPVAVSSAIMAREMDCDGDLAGQLVVWTTIVSAVTIFLTVMIFRAAHIF